jgi:hypothetical protein
MKVLLIAIAGAAALAAQSGSPNRQAEAVVLEAEDSFRIAKLKNDVKALDQIVAPEYIGVNQYGVIRNKAEVIELFRAFKLAALTPVDAAVRISGDTAGVTGRFTERNEAREEKLMFTRVWQRRAGRWVLISSTQMIPFEG